MLGQLGQPLRVFLFVLMAMALGATGVGAQATPTPTATLTPPGPATVKGIAWYDDNGNGVQDSGETPAAGARLTVVCITCQKFPQAGAGEAGPDGSFSVTVDTVSGAQQYRLETAANRPTGPAATTGPNYATSVRFVLSSGDTVTANAGMVPLNERYFRESGFRINDDAFWDYFNRRGGLNTFGYPESRTVTFLGLPAQFFQREVMQQFPDGSVHLLNLLDPGLLPYQSFNFSVFPAPDPALMSQAPAVGSANYGTAVIAFVQQRAPDSWNGLPVHFYQTFTSTVSLQSAYPTGGGSPNLLPALNLEIWGVPTSAPAYDPNNHNFVYLRFQRGIMHFDAGCHCTHGILLADYLKATLTGQNLPSDLAQEAAGSQFYLQYDPTASNWVRDPSRLPATNLVEGFERY
jgi:hypothetical protein